MERFKLKNLGEYHDLYLKTDMLLLSNIFEAFRNTCLQHYKLDPAHFYTSPGLAWQTSLKKVGVRLELLTDPDMLLMFDRGIILEVASPRLFIDTQKPTTSTWVRSFITKKIASYYSI